jgi:hypothetical protein
VIRASWQKSTAGIIETGALLLQAKEELGREAFNAMRPRLPFGKRTADRLMKIAGHRILSLETHASQLPPSWMTLHELTRLPDEFLLAKLEDGTICPDMERRDVSALVGRPKKSPQTEAPPDLIAAWKASPADRGLIFESMGVIELLTMIPPRLRAELEAQLERHLAAKVSRAAGAKPDGRLSMVLHTALSHFRALDNSKSIDTQYKTNLNQLFTALRAVNKKVRTTGKEPAVSLVPAGTINDLLKPHRSKT